MQKVYKHKGKFGCPGTWHTGKFLDVPAEQTDLKRHKSMCKAKSLIKPPQLTLKTRELIHVTSLKRAARIKKSKTIMGGEYELKFYKRLNLFWCGLSFNPKSNECRQYRRSMARVLKLHPQELDLLSSRPFDKKSQYGNVKFTFSLKKFLKKYENMIKCGAQFRILGTFKYMKREMNHAILVHPETMSERFKELPKLENHNKVELLVNRSMIAWKPQSTSCYAGSWEQVTFAFLLETTKGKNCALTLESVPQESYCNVAKPLLVNENEVYESKIGAKKALKRLLKKK